MKKFSLEKLNIIYNKAQEASLTQILLLTLIDFVHEFTGNKDLESLAAEITQQEIDDYKTQNELEQQALQELEAPYVKYLKYTDPIINRPNDEFKNYGHSDPEKNIETTWGCLTEKHIILTQLMTWLANQDMTHIAFVSRFATISCPLGRQYSKDKINIELKTPKYYAWLQENERLEYDQKDKVYYRWCILIWVYNTHKDSQNIAQGLRAQGKVLESARVMGLRATLKRTLLDHTEKVSPEQIEILKYSLQKVWLYIKEKLENKELPSEESIISIHQATQIENASIAIKGTSVSKKMLLMVEESEDIVTTRCGQNQTKFDKHETKKGVKTVALRFRLLLLIAANPKGISRKNLKELLNATDKQIDKAKRGINERMSENTENTQYLIRDTSGKILFNDKYTIELKSLKN